MTKIWIRIECNIILIFSGQYKEIVLLTKAGGGGGGGGGYGGGGGGHGGGGGGGYGGGGGGGGGDYGAPPPSSYGPPSGGGGGWGRSFGRRFITTDLERTEHTTSTSKNSPLNAEQPAPRMETTTYHIYRYPFINSNFTRSDWNYSNREELGMHQAYLTNNVTNMENDKEMEPLLRSESDNYTIETNPYRSDDSRDYVTDSRPVVNYMDNEHVTSTNYIANNYDKSVINPLYDNEWQPTEEKYSSLNLRKRSTNVKNSFA